MPELPSPEAFGDYDAWRGRAVTDRDGARVGSVDELYLDTDTRRPEWVLIRLDDDDDQRRFVPLADARVEDETLHLAHGRDRIAAAPAASPGPIPQGEERALYDHYAVPVTETESETVLPTEGAPPTDETVTDAPAPAPAPRPAAVVARPDTGAGDAPAASTTPDTAAGDADTTRTDTDATIVPDASAPGPAPTDAPPELVADEGTAPPELTSTSTPTTPGTGATSGDGGPTTTPPIPTPTATDAGGAASKAKLGAGAGIALFLLLLVIRRRRR